MDETMPNPPANAASSTPAPPKEAHDPSSAATSGPEGNQNDTRQRHRDDSASGRGRGGRGGRGSRGRGERGGGRRNHDMGRSEWSRTKVDRRKRNEEEQENKRRRIENGDASAEPIFSKDEIAAEERKPKRKVAVLIGYAGTGYKGMQIHSSERTIEGDIFKAFVDAGAISKANADDPKKSSLARCARTDKGVHAAGNVISLKLIVEDPDIVKKINEHLPPQIRVWGYERTTGSYSCYQTCDSRWYEYLIPTYSFLPPHPQSFMGKKLAESAKEQGVSEEWSARQEDAASFWEDTEKRYINPILDKLDPELRAEVMTAFFKEEGEGATTLKNEESGKQAKKESKPQADTNTAESKDSEMTEAPNSTSVPDVSKTEVSTSAPDKTTPMDAADHKMTELTAEDEPKSGLSPLKTALKEIKAAYIAAKRAYRISDFRKKRVDEVLNAYVGTKNFHNYTVQKSFRDPSAKRLIKSFKISKDPIIINDTEWLSLKVHGQSFMMHQIRKMVSMAALVVRCGAPTQIINDSFGPDDISIPKAPGLGLLLERPVFDSYNERTAKEHGKDKIDFTKFEKEMEEFKQKEIYARIWHGEEVDKSFHVFFAQIDNFRSEWFLWITAGGIKAAKQSTGKKGKGRREGPVLEAESEDEANPGGEEG